MFVPKHKSVARQRGFTLLEALIAFVILSIGLLGIVSLQAMAKTSQHLAVQHTRAVSLADALVERIRVNPAAVASYNTGLNNPIGGASLAGTAVATDCRTAACDPNDLAARDLWGWEQALDGATAQVGGTNTAGLLSPRGCVVFTAAPGRVRSGQLRVIVQWTGLQESFDAVQGTEDVCGTGAAGSDPYRRQVIVNTFVVDETEF